MGPGHCLPTSVSLPRRILSSTRPRMPRRRPGSQNIYQLTPDGFIKFAATDLTTVLGVAFDSRGHLFALEADTVAGFPGPQAVGTGKVVCVNSNGTLTTVASGLTFPTAM